jgi:fatty-acyl-CoA synthase
MQDEIARYAALFAEHVRPGGRISYIADSHPAFFFAAIAASGCGLAVAPINPRLTDQDIDRVLHIVDADGAILDSASRPRLESSGHLEQLKFTVDVARGPEAARTPQVAPLPGTSTSPCLLLSTSGTTGTPKLVPVTSEILWYSAVNCLVDCDFRRDDATLVITPVAHIAVWPWVMCTWLKGATVVMAATFDGDRFFDLVEENSISVWGAVTPLLAMLADHHRFATADLSSLRWFVCGGSALPERVHMAWADRGVEIRPAYGLSEAGGMATLSAPEDGGPEARSGRPMLLTDLAIENSDGRTDVIGEIIIRGRNVIDHYIHDEDQPDIGGWLHTGDLGRLDSSGRLEIVDRLKDMIKSGGENIFAAEVEAVISEHPAVADVAVIGRAHPKWGEAVTAVVTLHPGHALDLKELRDHSASVLARYKLPTSIEVVAAIPRTATGKIDKPALRRARPSR